MLRDTLNELEAAKLREAELAGKLNAALQPTLDGNAFKKLRKAGVDVVGLRSAVAQALKYVSRAELRELLKDGEQP